MIVVALGARPTMVMTYHLGLTAVVDDNDDPVATIGARPTMMAWPEMKGKIVPC